MLKRLETFNALPEKDALAELLSVCTSTVWASAVLDQRPFKDQTALLAASEAAWQLTGEGDWLEAFDGHPKIGDAQALQGGAETTAM
ncbi:MAG: bifunctional allantoicase/OHCU decarboxylase, partial [Gammaproteobacteria bacterium]|nr:bifunctional allantoicase/OHCU decarboxylase [Gammaproteobacteria bacterium]